MTDRTAAEVATALEGAADLYESEKYGWVQGRKVSGDGLRVCASQALMLACGAEMFTRRSTCSDIATTVTYSDSWMMDIDLYNQSMFSLGNGLGGPPDSMGGVVGFNDAKGRTKEEVIALFKNTAKDLRNQA
jgi:hypothetical protein